jgi:tetratricopeptide (TPR) repeat protein
MTAATLFAVALSTAACVAQARPAPCPPANQTATKPCTPATSQPSTPPLAPAPAQQFPFPGEADKPATTPASNAPKPSADTEHPFPTQSPDMPGDPGSSSSSSSSSSDSGDTPDTAPTQRRKLPKVQNLQSPDDRVDEDLRVAKFYFNQENFLAAYMRSKDAVKTEPDYAPTHFSLAQAAEKMKKSDEAKAEYNAYLKLAPNGEDAKAAHKALDQLQ